MGEKWLLRPELEFSHFVDSWNVRASPSGEAPIVGRLRPGEPFLVYGQDGDWLLLRDDHGRKCWTIRKFGDEDALVRVSETDTTLIGSAPAPPSLKRNVSRKDTVRQLLLELHERREALCQLENGVPASHTNERVRAAAAVQDVMSRLELLGIDQQLIPMGGCDGLDHTDVFDGVVVELKRDISYQHHEFDNPRKESCWLSTFFQSLWHSRVFHAAFDRFVKPLPLGNRGTALGALQETWKLYQEAEEAQAPPLSPSGRGTKRGVSVSALVRAWGRGYGDCAEAFGTLQAAPDLQAVANLFALVPIPYTKRVPSLRELWDQVVSMGVDDNPLLAIDLVLPPLTKSSIYTLTCALGPAATKSSESTRHEAIAPKADLGPGHMLIALICYIEEFQHYVVFCRRLSNASCWIFFNDLPGLARGALRMLEDWKSVAQECAHYALCPRLLLYENAVAAEEAFKGAKG